MKKKLQFLNFVCILFAVLFVTNKGIAQNTSAFVSLGNASINGAGVSSPCSATLTLNAGDVITIPFTLKTTTGNNIPIGGMSLALQWNSALQLVSMKTTGGVDYLPYWNTVASGPNSKTLVNNQSIGDPGNMVITLKVTTATTINLATDNLLYANIAAMKNAGGQYLINPPTSNAASASPCATNTITLPLKLISFTLQKSKNNEVVLQWTATNQVNTATFEIERSSNGRDWQTIGGVPAAGTYTANMDYSYTDLAHKNGSNYYRLKMIDIDGAFTYSPIQIVTFTDEAEKIAVWPSVTRDKIYVQGISTEVTVCIFDMTGQPVLKSKLTDPSEGLSLLSLQPKLYIVQIIKDGQLATTSKIIKQ
jgi:hypothetical protein